MSTKTFYLVTVQQVMNEVRVSHPSRGTPFRSPLDVLDKKNTFGIRRYGVDVRHRVGDFQTRHVSLWRTMIIDFVRVCWGVLHGRTKT